MKIEIKVELDKTSQELIQTTLNKVAENVVDFMNIFERISVRTENVADNTEDMQKESAAASSVEKAAEPPVKVKKSVKTAAAKSESKKSEEKEPEQTKSVKSSGANKNLASKAGTTGHKKKKTALGIVFNVIKKSGAINVENLKKETGFSARKVADAVYRLKKTGKIEKNDGGLYMPVG
ncbi:MAG: hypothetical protein AB7U45_04395 [Desulfamplus sp.]